MKIKDAIGRTWQCSTVQCDFNLPERFDLSYKASGGEMKRPIMVHRAIFGSIERFFGILVENCAGDFPLWLAPTQLRLLPVTDAVMDYCHEVKAKAEKLGVRCEVDSGAERLPKQIRNAEQKDKVPVMAIVGVKEMESGELAARRKGIGDVGSFDVDDLLEKLRDAADGAREFTEVGRVEVADEEE